MFNSTIKSNPLRRSTSQHKNLHRSDCPANVPEASRPTIPVTITNSDTTAFCGLHRPIQIYDGSSAPLPPQNITRITLKTLAADPMSADLYRSYVFFPLLTCLCSHRSHHPLDHYTSGLRLSPLPFLYSSTGPTLPSPEEPLIT